MNAFKTVAAYNSQPLESALFNQKVDQVFQLAKKEAYASGLFWGGSGLSGNLAILCLLGYGESYLSPLCYKLELRWADLVDRWSFGIQGRDFGRRFDFIVVVQRVSCLYRQARSNRS